MAGRGITTRPPAGQPWGGAGRHGPRSIEMTEAHVSAARQGSARVVGGWPGRRWRTLALWAALVGALGGCAVGGAFVRVEDLPAAPSGDEEYRVSAGDVVSVRVWNQEAMSVSRARVRDDGKISVPFLQDVEVAGRTPVEISSLLKGKLVAFVVSPVVTFSVDEVHPLRVPVTGEVARPGVYELDRRGGVLAALAAAGGFSEFAHRDAVHVLRYQLPLGERAPLRIRFTYRALARGERPAASFRLRDGDVLVVE